MLNDIKNISAFTMRESSRNRFALLAIIVILIGFFFAEFIGNLTLTEHRETQVALLAPLLRLCAVILMTLMVVTSTVREQQDKLLEMIIATAVSRESYYFGKLIGFVVVSASISIFFSALLMFYADTAQVVLWGVSLWLELTIVSALCLVMMFTFKKMPAALSAVMTIYLAARVMSSLVLMVQNPILTHTSLSERFMDGFIVALSWCLPDFSQFTQTSWLVYGDGNVWLLLPLLAQSFIYVWLLSMIALFDFYRKNF